MTARSRLAGFALLLAIVFAAGFGIGGITSGTDSRTSTHQEHAP